jgi:hypothetical protein
MLDAVLGNSESGKIQKKFKGRIPNSSKNTGYNVNKVIHFDISDTADNAAVHTA